MTSSTEDMPNLQNTIDSNIAFDAQTVASTQLSSMFLKEQIDTENKLTINNCIKDTDEHNYSLKCSISNKNLNPTVKTSDLTAQPIATIKVNEIVDNTDLFRIEDKDDFITQNLAKMVQHNDFKKESLPNGTKIEIEIDSYGETKPVKDSINVCSFQDINNYINKTKSVSDNCTILANESCDGNDYRILSNNGSNKYFDECICLDDILDDLNDMDSSGIKKEVGFNDKVEVTIRDDTRFNNRLREGQEQSDILSLSSDEQFIDLDLTPSLNYIDSISFSSIERINIENFIPNLIRSDFENNSSDAATNERIKQELLDDNSIKSDLLNDNESSCDGYNSSDFEFITEEEANINNYRPTKKYEGNSTCQENISIDSSSEYNSPRNLDNNPGASNAVDCNYANQNWVNNKWNYRRNPIEVDNSYRQNHEIPEGDDYIRMFQEVYVPQMPYMMENKCTTRSLMHVEFEGVGFDMHMLGRQINMFCRDDEYREEAEENARMIRQMYPEENRKRSRRY